MKLLGRWAIYLIGIQGLMFVRDENVNGPENAPALSPPFGNLKGP